MSVIASTGAMLSIGHEAPMSALACRARPSIDVRTLVANGDHDERAPTLRTTQFLSGELAITSCETDFGPESLNRRPSVIGVEFVCGLGEIGGPFTEISLKHLTILIDD